MSNEIMYFNSICTRDWCFYGGIEITGPGDDDFEVVGLEILGGRGCWAKVLGLVDRDIMAELRVILRDFRRRPERYELEPSYDDDH